MRHILVIIALIVTAWVIVPDAAQAHGMTHSDMAAAGMDDGCAGCPAYDAGTGGHDAVNCHHGAGCGAVVHALPIALTVSVDQPTLSRGGRPENVVLPRSAFLSRDLPPPRS